MPSYFDDTHRLLRESVRRFVERRIVPFVERWEEEESFPRELYRELGGYPYDRDPARPGWFAHVPNTNWADPDVSLRPALR